MRIATLLLALTAGCAATTTAPDGGTLADGGGVCCPIEGDPCGRPGGWSPGGWATGASGCDALRVTTFDGSFLRDEDEHGCAIWVSTFMGPGSGRPPTVCCGLFGGCPDAGTP